MKAFTLIVDKIPNSKLTHCSVLAESTASIKHSLVKLSNMIQSEGYLLYLKVGAFSSKKAFLKSKVIPKKALER